MLRKSFYLLYSIISYLLFMATFAYLIGFTGNLFVPRSIDNAIESPFLVALLINSILVALFGLSHSVMARQSFKNWWTKIVPQPIERSTYVLVASLMLALVMWQWRTIDIIIFDVSASPISIAFWLAFWSGWGLVVLSTFLINHLDFVGLRQAYLSKQNVPYSQLPFVVRSLYHLVRHPLQLGVILGIWSTPVMTAGHLLLAITMLIYIFIGLKYEERDLIATFGDEYREYAAKTPMLIPGVRAKSPEAAKIIH